MTNQVTQGEPFLVAEDLSAIGTMSLGAVIPIFATMGIPTAILPTQVLSTQTEGFGTPAKLASQDWLSDTFSHWQAQQVQLSGGLIGYVGQISLLQQITRAVSQLHLPLLIVDPVMGDGRSLYPGLGESYVNAMRPLVQLADVITPNWSEAQFLTGTEPMTTEPSEAQVNHQLVTLKQSMASDGQVVITGIPIKGKVVTAYLDGSHSELVASPKCPGHFYGAGDVFSALLSGALMQQVSLSAAVHLAVKGTLIALRQTSAAGHERRFGMQLSQLLQWLTKQADNQLDSKQ